MGADRIVVLENGRVADIGTHAELVSRPGLYRRVWEIQGMSSWKK
jgi:ATP-binding cassette subfamily B protein